MCEAALACGATIVQKNFHHFSPYGVSGVVVIAESHVTVHTWPEHGYAAVDIFSCNLDLNRAVIRDYIQEHFRAAEVSSRSLKRGILPEPAKNEASTRPE